ncbi:MAG TPA: HdeD family acid-resistance protein [Ktedonobacterales bacterium]
MSTSAWAPTGTAPTTSKWSLIARGVLAILFGFLVWVWPGLTLLVFTFMFGIFAIAGGIFALISAIRSTESNKYWWVLAIAGVVSIIIGILSFVWPGKTAILILYLVGIWAVITGILEIIAAFRSRESATNEWLLVLGGVISIVFGVILMALPGIGLLALLWFVGLWAVVYGIVEIVHAFTRHEPAAQVSAQTAQGTYREPTSGTPLDRPRGTTWDQPRGTPLDQPPIQPPPEPPGAWPA